MNVARIEKVSESGEVRTLYGEANEDGAALGAANRGLSLPFRRASGAHGVTAGSMGGCDVHV